MDLFFLRLDLFYRFLDPFQKRSRTRRMRSYASRLGIKDGYTVIDLGGQSKIWEALPVQLNITILNKPGIAVRDTSTTHSISYLDGDACEVNCFQNRSFDVVFSNSVLEHVGAFDKRARFAHEVRRLGRSYWVQTPSKWFPIEAHCGMPFWWFYPFTLRRFFIERWRKKLPEWTEMVEETTVVSRSELRALFPDARIISEKVFGIPKSYVAYFIDDGRTP